METAPLVRLPWDIGDYAWQIPHDRHVAAEQRPFSNTIKYRRLILAGARNCVPIAGKAWEEYGIPDETLINFFWNRLSKKKHSRRINTFQ